jgi:hypothetical protein
MYNSLEDFSSQDPDDDDPWFAAAHDISSASTLAESPLEHATNNKATIAKKSIKILRIATFNN